MKTRNVIQTTTFAISAITAVAALVQPRGRYKNILVGMAVVFFIVTALSFSLSFEPDSNCTTTPSGNVGTWVDVTGSPKGKAAAKAAGAPETAKVEFRTTSSKQYRITHNTNITFVTLLKDGTMRAESG